MILTPILAIGPLDIPNIFDIFSLPIFAEGYTPEGTAISDAAGLSAVQEGQKYYLTNTIIIDENYTPISVAGVTIDGKDENGTVHTIQFGSDVNVGVTNKGLFTSTTLIDGVTIKNVNLTGKLISNDANALHVSPIFYSTTSDSGFQGKVTLSNIKCGVSVHKS